MGTGVHGGFPRTNRPATPTKRRVSLPPVQKPGDVWYNSKKMEEYLLNRDHP